MNLPSELVSSFVKATKDTDRSTKESTVYGTIKNDAKGKPVYVQIDGSDQLTPISTTSNITTGDRVVVMIKDHSATIVGNITSPSATTTEVGDVGNQVNNLEIIVADKIGAGELEAELGRIDTIYAETVEIRGKLTAQSAKIDQLEAKDVKINNSLTAASARIDKLESSSITTDLLDAKYAKIEELEAVDAKIYNLDATYGDFQELTTTDLNAIHADITELKAKDAEIEDLAANKANIADLEATDARIDNLQADVADIDTLIFGSASGNTIHANFANAVIAQLSDAQIKSAMIDSVSANKISSGDILTNNVRVLSEDGKLLISDETIQISDDTRVRVQIGKDAAGDYSINIWDTDGNLMFSEGGITDKAIKDAIIRDDMVSDTANISATKLDIESLFSVINGDGSNTLNASKIKMDAEGQTLDVSFTQMTTNIDTAQETADEAAAAASKNASDITKLNSTVSSQGTDLSIVQGQISGKVWQQDIDSAKGEMSTQYSSLEQEVDGISATVSSHTTQINNKADSSTVTEVSNRVTSLESGLSGFQSTVSSTYATKTELNNIEVGGRNLLPNTKTFKGSNVIAGSASFSEETYKGFSVRTKDHSDVTDRYSDMVTFTNFYVDKLGEEYTLSYYAKGSGTLTTYFYGPTDYIRITKCVQSDGSIRASADGASPITLTDTWTRYWVTWTLAETGDISIPKWILFRLSAGGQADICGVKLEKGNRATDWTPAVEDVDADITSVLSAAEAAQATANQNAQDMANIVTSFNNDIDNLQIQIDGSITTWFYEVEPTNSNPPAVNWTTVDMKNVHLGDLYYDTITGYCYRYQVKNNTYSWQRITDTDVTKALADAQTAQDTADQKRRVFYVQPTPPYDAGDLWVQGGNGDILRCQTSKIAGQTYSSTDWIAASKYTDDTVANSAAQAANAAQQAASMAQNDIDNLTIGGRNLLRNSKGDSNTDWAYAGSSIIEDSIKGLCSERINDTASKENYLGSTRTDRVDQSTEYTFSADLWCNEYLKSYDFFWLSDTDTEPKTAAGYINVLSSANRILEPNKWQRICWTFTTKADDRTGFIRIDNNGSNTEGEIAILRIANLKLEKGNRATDWTPAPEDLESRVTQAETKIIQNDSSITTLANRTTNVENKFAGYSTTEQMNSAIAQSANSIVSSVSSTYTTKTDFNNLSIGGRNLVAGTDEITEYVGNASDTSNNYKDVWSAKTIDPVNGTEYIVSFDAKANIAQNVTCYFYSPNTTTSAKSSTGQSTTAADGACQVSITTEWVRYWVKWTQTAAEAQKNIIVGRNFTENDIYIRAVKFEVGNKATDWSPAPEDMATTKDVNTAQSTANTAQETASNAETLIQQLSHSISMLVTDGNGTSLMTQTEDGWTFSTAEIQSNVSDIAEGLDALTNELGDTTNAVDVLKQAVDDLGEIAEYVKIGTYEDEPCIELGESDSEFKMRITNTRILFMEGSNVVAHISNQSLHIKKAVIEEELQQGGFVWKVRSNGNMGLIWKGVSS